MKAAKIDHLGIAVRDVDPAAQPYQTLGLSLEKTLEVPEQKVRVQQFPV